MVTWLVFFIIYKPGNSSLKLCFPKPTQWWHCSCCQLAGVFRMLWCTVNHPMSPLCWGRSTSVASRKHECQAWELPFWNWKLIENGRQWDQAKTKYPETFRLSEFSNKPSFTCGKLAATKSVQKQWELSGIWDWYASVNLHVQYRCFAQDCNSYTQHGS